MAKRKFIEKRDFLNKAQDYGEGQNIINKSINFPKYHSNPVQIVDIEIREVE